MDLIGLQKTSPASKRSSPKRHPLKKPLVTSRELLFLIKLFAHHCYYLAPAILNPMISHVKEIEIRPRFVRIPDSNLRGAERERAGAQMHTWIRSDSAIISAVALPSLAPSSAACAEFARSIASSRRSASCSMSDLALLSAAAASSDSRCTSACCFAPASR